LATRFGEDVGVTALFGRSLAFWMLGYPEAVRAETDRTLKHAREIGQVATLMRSLYHASLSHAFRGDFVAANALGDELFDLADEQRSPAWKPLGMIAQGYVLRLMGKASDAVQVGRLLGGVPRARTARSHADSVVGLRQFRASGERTRHNRRGPESLAGEFGSDEGARFFS
jgi:hypothetical protein